MQEKKCVVAMVKKWMAWVNIAAGAIVIALLIAAVALLWMRPTEFPLHESAVRKSSLPKGSFRRSPEDYNAINSPVLSLKFSPLSVQLPDLRRLLIYYGKNSRPDGKEEKTALYFSFAANKPPVPVPPEQRMYLTYDKPQKQYAFSVDNAETPLWMEAHSQGSHALVKVGMLGDNGEEVQVPAVNAEFTLPEKEYVRAGGTSWELGKWKVDGTLLARQKAKWFGVDRFLEKHGGDEFEDFKDKQRIDFGDGEELYSVYVGLHDCMVWKDGRWQVMNPGKESLGYPMLCIKKVDERIMNLELWDVDGKSKLALNLLKSNEAWLPQNLQQSFKFVGARTRSQFVFEVNKERTILRPHDWLVLTDTGWRKLSSPEEIDEFVERKIVGPLFVFDGIERRDERQVIIGTLFNAARTEMTTVEIPLQQGGGGPSHGDKEQKGRDANARPDGKEDDDYSPPRPPHPRK